VDRPAERAPPTGSARSVEFDRAAFDAVVAACASDSDPERCGGLVGRLDPVRIERACPVENSAASPDRAWAIPADRVRMLDRAAADLGLHVVGFYHSHPNGPATPSAADLAGAWPGYVYVIVAHGGAGPEVRAWRLAPDRSGFEEVLIRMGTTT